MVITGAYISNNTLAYAGNNSSLTGTAYQTVDVSAHGYARLNLQLDAILSHGADHRCFDNLGVNAHLHSLQHVTTCQIDGAATFKAQIDLCSVSSNQSINNAVHIAACQIMSLQLVYVHIQASLVSLN